MGLTTLRINTMLRESSSTVLPVIYTSLMILRRGRICVRMTVRMWGRIWVTWEDRLPHIRLGAERALRQTN